MEMTVPEIDITTAEGFEALLQTRQEPEWLLQQRRDAFELYLELSARELDPEEFRRVELRLFRPADYRIMPHTVTQSTSEKLVPLMLCRTEFAGQVTHSNGHAQNSHLSEELQQKGVIFCPLERAVNEHGDLVREHFMTRAVRPDSDRFAAWHAAFWTGGVFLYVPRNVELDVPLHSLIGLSANGAADLSHTLVVLEEGARATLLEETASTSEKLSGLHLGAVELLVKSNAHLQYVQLQNWNERVFHFAHQGGRVDRNGQLQWTVGALGSKLSHVHQDVLLDGQGAFAQVNGVAFATERQKLSYYTRQAHLAPNTTSDLLYKEVVRDRARMIWRGMIEVAPAAQLTDGFQRNDSLILSPDARVDAIPGLEIDADDVRCTHAATAGQVDEDQILYCMSRGISRQESMHAIVEGFFQQVIDRIGVEIVRDTLRHSVETKLGFGS
ncbi:MAG: Fe-S cluster assembly protein SufD [Planctomycetaceae bacterium]|nr:Fe-S cluster assembly protein SufD [Planctomycetaceae bacterium]